MEAYERSLAKGAATFAEGGVVSSGEDNSIEPSPNIGGEEKENLGSFTIVVEKEGRARDFPVTGKVSVLRGLKAELEEERLTRLH